MVIVFFLLLYLVASDPKKEEEASDTFGHVVIRSFVVMKVKAVCMEKFQVYMIKLIYNVQCCNK